MKHYSIRDKQLRKKHKIDFLFSNETTNILCKLLHLLWQAEALPIGKLKDMGLNTIKNGLQSMPAAIRKIK